MTRRNWLGLLACVLAVGCTKPPSVSVHSPTQARPTATSSQPTFQQFNFGRVLIRREPLRHEFIIENPTENLVRVVQSVAMTPCFSSVEDHPREIQPHGKVAIPVVLKPGGNSGGKSVSFLVETDQPGRGRHLLGLFADLRPEWEIVAAEANARPIPLGVGGKLAFEVICRRQGEAGLSLPDAIEVPAPFQLTDDPSQSESEQTDLFVESRRTIVVDVPPATQIGLNRGALRFRWNDGSHREHDFGGKSWPPSGSPPRS